MAFRISKRQSADQFLHSVANSQFERAFIAVSRRRDEGASRETLVDDVHLVRRLIKRLRALIRLVAPSASERIDIDKRLRNAARLLADLRDAHVSQATLESVIASAPHEIQTSGIQWLNSRLSAVDSENASPVDCIEIDSRWKEVGKTLKLCSKAIGKWQITGHGFDPFYSGIRKTYRQARLSFIAAKDSNSSESWHEFRKDLKYHGAQIRLLCPICPPLLSAHRTTAEEIAELLGRDHDLAVLSFQLNRSCEIARAEFADEEIEQIATLNQLIEREQQALRRKSSQLASYLLSETPQAFASRLRGYWDRWSHGRSS